MKDYKKAGELYLQLTEILSPTYGDRIQFHLGEIKNRGIYMHIMKKEIGTTCEDFICIDMNNPNIEEIIHQAKKMFEPKFIQVKNAYVDLIGKTVYIDKKEPSYIIERIDRKGIWLDNYYPIDLNRLYIKE